MNPVGWFEIPVTDLDRAEAFYTAVFDLKMIRQEESGGSIMSWFPFEEDVPQAAGTLIKGEGFVPSVEGTLVYFSATDLDRQLELVQENGGEVLLPGTDIGQYGVIAHFKDTEGNRVALHARK